MVDMKRRSFFKGSAKLNPQPLPWLKNVDTFSQDCTRCQKCLPVCETNIIILGDGGFPTLDFQKNECTFCYACAAACPESLFLHQQSPAWQQVIRIEEKCLAKNKIECHNCADSCETQAIKFERKINHTAQPVVSFTDCTGCGACISYCPVDAIKIESQTSNE